MTWYDRYGWCKPGWDKQLVNVTFYKFLRCLIL